MEKFLELAEQLTNSEVTTTQQINEDLFKEFLTKNTVWGFRDLTKEDYSMKNNSEKIYLIVKYYNEMLKGKIRFLHFQLLLCLF